MANATPEPVAPVEETPAATDETTPVEDEFSAGPSTTELTLRQPRGFDPASMDKANKMLSIVTAQGYNPEGISVGTVSTNGFYPNAADAQTAAKPLASLLARVAPDDKNVGTVVSAKAQGDISGFGFYLYLKPKGAPRAPRTEEQKAAAKAKREAAKAAKS